jgi:CTP synthase
MERHRHRYEVNPAFVQTIEKDGEGLLFTGRDDQGERMEIAELSRAVHPFYFGTQFHPEFKSRPNRLELGLAVGVSIRVKYKG